MVERTARSHDDTLRTNGAIVPWQRLVSVMGLIQRQEQAAGSIVKCRRFTFLHWLTMTPREGTVTGDRDV